MKERENNLNNNENTTQHKKSDDHIEDSVKNGQKAIAIQKEVNDLPEGEENKDAENWRNEG